MAWLEDYCRRNPLEIYLNDAGGRRGEDQRRSQRDAKAVSVAMPSLRRLAAILCRFAKAVPLGDLPEPSRNNWKVQYDRGGNDFDVFTGKPFREDGRSPGSGSGPHLLDRTGYEPRYLRARRAHMGMGCAIL